MPDKTLPYTGSARGGGTQQERYAKAIDVIKKGLEEAGEDGCAKLVMPCVHISNYPEKGCDCGCSELTVLEYKCLECGKKVPA